MGAFTMRFRKLFLLGMILGVCHIGWAQSPTYGVGSTPSEEGNPCLGYLHQSYGTGAPAGTRNSQGRRAAFCAERVRGMPRGNIERRPGSRFDQRRT